MMTRTEILKEYGITDGREIRVQVVQEIGAKEKGALSLVGLNAIGNPVTTISTKQAAELSVRLRQIDEKVLAEAVSMAAQKAQKVNQSGA